MEVLPKQSKKASRAVETKDMKRVKAEGKEIILLCRQKLGRYPCALALAHCQVDHVDPLRFFVFNNGRIIINPKIEDSSGEYKRDTEGCFSYPFRPEVSIIRDVNITVSYTEITKTGRKKNIKNQKIDGMLARIFQHEIDHMNGIAIYS